MMSNLAQTTNYTNIFIFKATNFLQSSIAYSFIPDIQIICLNNKLNTKKADILPPCLTNLIPPLKALSTHSTIMSPLIIRKLRLKKLIILLFMQLLASH